MLTCEVIGVLAVTTLESHRDIVVGTYRKGGRDLRNQRGNGEERDNSWG